MFDLSTNAIIVAFTTYIVSGFYLLYKQEQTEKEWGQVITFWDRIPVFVPLINTFFAVWVFAASFSQNRYNRYN